MLPSFIAEPVKWLLSAQTLINKIKESTRFCWFHKLNKVPIVHMPMSSNRHTANIIMNVTKYVTVIYVLALNLSLLRSAVLKLISETMDSKEKDKDRLVEYKNANKYPERPFSWRGQRTDLWIEFSIKHWISK